MPSITPARTRYPGAQPFADNDLARRTFFGRGSASVALTDQILASRLVVVYAKSGLGKTSLLNAGVAPRLREAAAIPLFTRVNDIERGPMVSVLHGIQGEAERQKVEYVHGTTGSLWAFFKSVEFWRQDLLLTPVLILDQFEELFTLQSETVRDDFLVQLGHLVRGVPPAPDVEAANAATPNAPPVHIVLSLREDFLGILEEAADHIPQILNHRFRLTPLSSDTAAQAITGPAGIHDPALATRPFRVDPELVNAMLGYLCKSGPGAQNPRSRYVEPFHLQLICQRMEQIAASRQKTSNQEIVLRLDDLGGMEALTETLAEFYADAVRSVRDRHLRPAVRRMCEQFLISPEGRRLSLEEWELQRQLGLSPSTLRHLVERRLLRTDRRSESTYYELSHDALVEPVLAARRIQVLAMGWAQLVAGWATLVAMACLTVVCVMALLAANNQAAMKLGVLVMGISALAAGSYGIRSLRAAAHTRRRYGRHGEGQAGSPPMLRPLKDRVLGWGMVELGSAVCGLAIFGLLLNVSIHVSARIVEHSAAPWVTGLPPWVRWAEETPFFHPVKLHPVREAVWGALEACVLVLCGGILIQAGRRRLWPDSFRVRFKGARVPGLERRTAVRSAVLRIIGALALFAVPTQAFLILRHCLETDGRLPDWARGALINHDLEVSCENIVSRPWASLHWDLELFYVFSFLISIGLFLTGINALARAVMRRG